MKKKMLSILLALILLLSTLSSGTMAAESAGIAFEDIKSGAWYYEAVLFSVQHGLMTGESEKHFAPDAPMTRAMLASALFCLDGSKKTDKTIKFSDVSKSSKYYDAVEWAASNGIAEGYDSGAFGASESVTRQQLAVMLQRYAKCKGRRVDVAIDLSAYADSTAIDGWAQSAMEWAVFGGLILGRSNSGISPNGYSTRAEAATILKRYVKSTELEKQTDAYLTEFVKGSFDNFYNSSSDGLRQAITKERLATGFKDLSTAVSSYGECLGSVYGKDDLVASFVSGSKYNLKVTIRYDSAARPDGIRTTIVPKDPPAPQTTNKWEEVSVKVGEKKLPGMLTLPKGVEKPPVVILVQGSGSSDMNESLGIGSNHPFEDIAHDLAEKGVATLRYNKRTYQCPTDACNSIEYETIDDASAAAKLLSGDSRVDTNRIFLLGHSQGGMMAPKITADNPEIKGLISMAGSLRSSQDIILDQFLLAIKTETSMTEQQKSDALAQEKAELEKSRTLNDGGTGVIMGFPTEWWKSLNAIDSVTIVKNLKVPMLILQGSADFQVLADKDFKLWQTTLAGRDNVEFKLYDGLSHLFMPNQIPANGGIDTAVYMTQNHIDPKVITDIAAWVNKQ